MTVIEHVLSRLKSIGVTDVFGVPGDFAFPVNDAISLDAEMRWIGCCNELNAAYAADGYARIKGVGAVCTTYGVGELSALAAIAGSYAEHLPIFHLVGAPSMSVQAARALMHHTLGNGEYDLFHRMSQPVVCASAILTPQNVEYETERLITEALYHRRPVYMAFPADLANQSVLGCAQPISIGYSEPNSLAAATEAIVSALAKADSACILPGILVARAGLQSELLAFVNASGLPFATMFMAKSVLDEQHPSYIGMYDGKLMNQQVAAFVEGCDCVIAVGTLFTDFNTGSFTANIDPERTITIAHHHVRIGKKVYPNVEIQDLLATLVDLVPRRVWGASMSPPALGFPVGSGTDPITADATEPIGWNRWLECPAVSWWRRVFGSPIATRGAPLCAMAVTCPAVGRDTQPAGAPQPLYLVQPGFALAGHVHRFSGIGDAPASVQCLEPVHYSHQIFADGQIGTRQLFEHAQAVLTVVDRLEIIAAQQVS
jgi:indolepyruvate decarboxylase